MDKKHFGLFVFHHLDENGEYVPTSPHLICVSSNKDKLLEYGKILQDGADLLKELLPNRGYHSSYGVDEVNYLDL